MKPDTPRKPFDSPTPRNPNPEKVDNRVRGLSKSMRRVDELEKDYKKDRNLLTQDEKRLLDLITFQKTGKHIDEFKNKPEPNNGRISIKVGGGSLSKEDAKKEKKLNKHAESVS